MKEKTANKNKRVRVNKMSITNINEIDKWINIFYGEVLMHGTDEEKERANIIVDYISFLEKSIGIKKCVICGKKFTAKTKVTVCCSDECKKQREKQVHKEFYQRHKKEINEKYSDYRKKYIEKNSDKVKEYQKAYREKHKEVF